MGSTGFSDEAFAFYEGLAADNSRTYWTAHKQEYDAYVRAPMEALVAELEPEFGSGKVFRPYRDLRFSADKSPYKPYQSAVLGTSPGIGYYLDLDAERLAVGAGFHAASAEHTHRYREAVDDEQAGAELVSVTERLATDGFALVGDRVKTWPRGCPPDHPRLSLMRYRWLGAERAWPVSAELESPEALGLIRADLRRLRPLVDWLLAHVGTPAP